MGIFIKSTCGNLFILFLLHFLADTGMTTKIKITRGEVAVGAWTGMSVINIVERKKIIVGEAEVAAQVQTTLEAGGEAVMMMKGGAAVGRWEGLHLC